MRRTWAYAGGLVLARIALSATAHAAEPPAATLPALADLRPKERLTERTFYGWQILAISVPAGVVTGLSLALPARPLGTVPSTVGFLVGVPVYAFTGPVVHWMHEDFTKGIISFAGSVAFPVVGGLTVREIRCGASDAADDCGRRAFGLGAAIGFFVAPVLDGLLLGWQDEQLDDVARSGTSRRVARREVPAFTWVPTVDVGSRDVKVGLWGTF